MNDKTRAVEFDAEIKTVKTLTSGVVQVTLELPEYCDDQAAEIFKHRLDMVRVVMEFIHHGRR